MPLVPRFIMIRLDGITSVTMNAEFAGDLADFIQFGVDVPPHLWAFMRQLQGNPPRDKDQCEDDQLVRAEMTVD